MAFNPEEVVRNKILFDLLVRSHGKHWKEPFELEIPLASRRFDAPISKDAISGIGGELARAIQFYHGAAMAIDMETQRARPIRGEPTGYVFFDGYTLRIGSIGYQAD